MHSHPFVQHVLLSSTLMAEMLGLSVRIFDPQRAPADQFGELWVSIIVRVYGGEDGISQTDVAALSGWHRKTVGRYLEPLIERGIIIRRGRDNYVSDPNWIVAHVERSTLDASYEIIARIYESMRILRGQMN